MPIRYLTDIHFGAGAITGLPDLLQELNIRRPLVVTDPGIVAAGLVDQLNLEPIRVFDNVQTNPSESSAKAGLAMFRESQCDGLIAIGGGSPIDCAKCVALLANHTESLAAYALINGGLSKITGNRPAVIAIPTTAGTGSEVGRAALVTLSGGTKLAIVSPYLIPDAAICDPNLTLGLPPGLTAATGMDAISHCVENYCSDQFNPPADAIALDGLQRAHKNLRLAVRDETDISARTEMMVAALHGGLTFQKGLGAIHALSHPLGGLEHKRLHHGTLNAIFLPHVLRYNMNACPEKMEQMARALNVPKSSRLPEFFSQFVMELGLPLRLRDLDVTREDLEPMSETAIHDHCSKTNPRPMTIDDCRSLYQSAS